MTLFYYCRTCNADCASDAACLNCDSDDIAVESRVEYDDERDAERLAQIKRYWDAQYAAMDLFAAAKGIARAANTDASLDQIVELARGSYELPPVTDGWMSRKQAGGV